MNLNFEREECTVVKLMKQKSLAINVVEHNQQVRPEIKETRIVDKSHYIRLQHQPRAHVLTV